MATSSNPETTHGTQQSSVGGNLEVARVIEHNRNKEIWSHYDLCEMTNGTKKARCKLCNKFFAPEGNTTLRNHLSKSCKALRTRSDTSQANMTPQGGLFVYDNDKLREAFTKFVITKALPFDHFDDEDFTTTIQQLMQPRYTAVSRTTLRRDAIKMWRVAREKMILGFQEHRYSVSLTCDVWSSPHNTGNSFLAVTAHWLEQENWQMMKRTIAFELFGEPHTGANLFALLKRVICLYNLETKIFSMSFDNASNNTNAIPRLKLLLSPILDGAFFHTRCVAHIINLSVQAGLEVIEPIRLEFKEMIKSVLCYNNKRLNDYRRYCKSVNKKALGAHLDCPTRWNSTWMMMRSALRQQETLQAFHNQLYESGHVPNVYPGSSWEVINKITDLLGVFKDATTFLSGVYYPTSPLVLNQIFLLASKLNEFEFETQVFQEIGYAMKEKLLKYFKELPPVFTCAAALNPTVNVGGVETLIESIASAFGLHEEDPDFIQNQLSFFNKCFRDMFEIYLQKYGASSAIHEQMRRGAEASSSRGSNISMSLFNTLMNSQSKRARTTTQSSELGNYMSSNFIGQMTFNDFQNLDILAWWKEKEPQFPILAAMARDLLTVQASTVASESAFSVSGRVISQRRSRLSPESVEVCICLKDYLDGAARKQHQTTLEDALDPDLERNINNEEIELGISPPNEEDDDNEGYGEDDAAFEGRYDDIL